MIRNFVKETLVPRVVYLPYLLAKGILLVLSIVHWASGARRPRSANSILCIEAGVRGWESIEFKELLQSAGEYMQPDNVRQLVIQPDKSYVKQVARALSAQQITHYVYDPRTGSQRLWSGLWQSLRVAILLQKHGVVPIVILTDLSVRSWRAQSAVVSARRGLVVCYISARCVGPIFPHRRLMGPSLMPFSIRTKQSLDVLIERRPQRVSSSALFAGSLYEPRKTVLENIRAGLAARGLEFDIKGRVLGSARVPDHEYWARLCHSDIVVTTADQMIGAENDWSHIPHLVYRYIEVLASGALLVAQDVPGVRRYFTPGVHFVSFDSPEHAIEVIAHFMQNDADRLEIARQGRARAEALISSRCFWVSIDSALGSAALH